MRRSFSRAIKLSEIDSYINELELNSVSYDECRRKHGETILKYKIVDSNTICFDEFISFNPLKGNKTGKFICNLADKHNVRIIGTVEPFFVGPSVTKRDAFYVGMDRKSVV